MAKFNVSQTTGIYLIKNNANRCFYIGSALNLKRRWREHRHQLKSNTHFNSRLQRSWNKYGKDAFSFLFLEACLPEKLIQVEQKWLDYYKVGINKKCYNFLPTAHNFLGYVRTEKTKKKISDANKGKKHTDEAKLKMRLAKLGTKQSPETIAKRALGQKGKKINRPTGINGYSIRKFTPQQIRKMRMLKEDGFSFGYICSLFSVSLGGLQKIIYRQTYKDVE